MGSSRRLVLFLLLAIVFLLMTLSCMVGTEFVSFSDFLRAIFQGLGDAGEDSMAPVIVNEIRLPRACAAVFCGAALGMAGTVLQGLFRNSLADPGLIGVSSGGALGALLVFSFGGVIFGFLPMWLHLFLLPFAAMAGALLITLLVLLISGMVSHLRMSGMLLVGVAINSAVAALAGLILHFSADNQIRNYTFWMLGGLDRAEWRILLPLVVFVFAGTLILPRFALALDALALGEPEARSLGVNLPRLRKAVIWFSAAMVGAAVSVGGMIGFVGLIAPHLVRILFGPAHRFLLPASALVGGILLLLADGIARIFGGVSELPLGVVTAMIGAPFFIAILLRGEKLHV